MSRVASVEWDEIELGQGDTVDIFYRTLHSPKKAAAEVEEEEATAMEGEAVVEEERQLLMKLWRSLTADGPSLSRRRPADSRKKKGELTRRWTRETT